MATISSGPKGRLALLLDEASQQRFLVNTGCSYSITYVAVLCARPWEPATCRQPPFHLQSNNMVEGFYRQVKVALRARCRGAALIKHLPWVLLGLHVAPKAEAGLSAAEAT